jgi:type VI secretion system VgrG family protein
MPITGLSTKYTFQSEALDPDTFRVLDFQGEEEISRLFRFEINLISEHSDIDLETVLEKSAFLGLERDGELRKVHGIVAEFEQLERGPAFVHYRAVLVPRLWKLSLRHQTQIYQDMTVGQIIEKSLKDAGFISQDYEISLKEKHPQREYVVQYQESDFNFISRLMEHEGIFYFFSHDDERDKIVIADKNEKLLAIEGETDAIYRPPAGIAEADKESVLSLVCRQKRVPKEVILKDYNWRTPSLDLTVKTTVDEKGEGLFYEYGNHYKDKEGEGSPLAKVRAEEIRCRQKLFFGESNLIRFRAGSRFTLAEHYRSDFNQGYLLHRVVHSGSELSAATGASAKASQTHIYRNQFVCGAAVVPYRPERLTTKPRIVGALNAKVDAGGNGPYAVLDDQGRYKVAIPFDPKIRDLSKLADGHGSCWIRKAEPYAGPHYGMHHPLHKNAEVILVHENGDPDRPVISAAVPNPENTSPVTSANESQSIVRTAGKNEVVMEDSEASKRAHIYSPHATTYLDMGASGGHDSPEGIVAGTQGGISLNAGKALHMAAGASCFRDGGTSTTELMEKLQTWTARGAAIISLASANTAETLAAGNVGVLALCADLLGAAIGWPGHNNAYLSSPTKVAVMGGGEVFLAAGAALDLTAAGVANIQSLISTLVAALKNVSVVGGSDVEMVSIYGDVKVEAKESGDVKIEGKKNVIVTAESNNINLVGKREVDIIAEEAEITLHALKENVDLIGKKSVLLSAEEESIRGKAKEVISFNSGKHIKLESEKASIDLDGEGDEILIGSKKVRVECGDVLELKCGQASITLAQNGEITINGMKVNTTGTTAVNVNTDGKCTVQGSMVEAAAKSLLVFDAQIIKIA